MQNKLDFDAPANLSSSVEIDDEINRLREKHDAFLKDNAPAQTVVRNEEALQSWKVREVDCNCDALSAVDDSEFAAVELPDYRLSDLLHYRHIIQTPTIESGSVHLCFGAVDYEATVFVNGQLVGEHKGYFAPFSFDISNFLDLRTGSHQIDVLVRRANDLVQWDGALAALNYGDAHGKGLGSVVADRMTAGAGLHACVKLEFRQDFRIDELWATGDPKQKVASVSVTLTNNSRLPMSADLKYTIRPRNGTGTTVGSSISVEVPVGAKSQHHIEITVPDAEIWQLDTPWLYWVDAELRVEGEIVDAQRSRLAFRSFMRADDGSLKLNAEPCFLLGTTTIGCLWEAAWRGDETAVIKQLLLVKTLFANTLRVHVHVLPEIVYDCADRLGVLIYQDTTWQWPCFDHVSDNLEAELEQVTELVRHIRDHPSVVILCLSNEMHMGETLHDADFEYLRRAQEIAGDLAPGLVLVQDHTGPDRPKDLVCSVHEYPGYFVGTARSEMGILTNEHRGHRTIVSEYGAGALESWPALMQLAEMTRAQGQSINVPSTPEDLWTVEGLGDHMLAETLNNTQRIVGKRSSWRGYHSASNEHQARALSYQTGALRRDRERVSGVIQHYLQYPAVFGYNPWCDLSIVDAVGVPTSGFNALREIFRPLALSIVAGGPRAFEGSSVSFDIWIHNDLPQSQKCYVSWRWECGQTGEVFEKGGRRANAPSASSYCFDNIKLSVPLATSTIDTARLAVSLIVDDREWNAAETTVKIAQNSVPVDFQLEIIGNLPESSSKLEQFGVEITALGSSKLRQRIILVTPEFALSKTDEDLLYSAAQKGARVVVLERPAGETLRWIDPSQSPIVMNNIPSEVIQPEQSLRDSNLGVLDLTDWPSKDGRLINHPLLAVDTRSSPRWASCGNHLSLSAIHEFVVGHGSILVCQALIWDHLTDEPSAWRLLHHMLVKPTRKI